MDKHTQWLEPNEAENQEDCGHYSLDRDGICRDCGADRWNG